MWVIGLGVRREEQVFLQQLKVQNQDLQTKLAHNELMLEELSARFRIREKERKEKGRGIEGYIERRKH